MAYAGEPTLWRTPVAGNPLIILGDKLAARGILGMRVLWFEQDDDAMEAYLEGTELARPERSRN